MLNWLRYFPLSLSFCRNLDNHVVPQGPLFPKLREQYWVIGSSRFRFAAPWANSVYGMEPLYRQSKSFSSGRRNVLTYELWPESRSVMPNSRWHSSRIYSRRWYFVGPWFSGSYGGLHMGASLWGQPHLEDFKNASFFHPRVFESVIADFLSSYYGHFKDGRKSYYRGPINWKIIPLSQSIQAASFDICSDVDGIVRKYIVFPVSHDRFLSISFSGIYQEQRRYDQTPVINLMQSIIDTFRLEVGPDMQSQWDEVKAFCPDMSLTTEYGELKWPINPKDVGRKTKDAGAVPTEKEITAPAVERLSER